MYGNTYIRNNYLLSSISSSSNKSRQQQLIMSDIHRHQQQQQQTIATGVRIKLEADSGFNYRMRISPAGQLERRKSCSQSNSRTTGANDKNENETILNDNNRDNSNKINKIRNFSEFSKQQRQRQHDQYQDNNPTLNLATLASGIEQPCATTASGCGGSSANTPEAAANAMVNMVRLILLILICVLLVKLRAPKKGSRAGSRARPRNDDSQFKYRNQLIDDNNNNNNLTPKASGDDNLTCRQHDNNNNSNTRPQQITNSNQPPPPRRKISQPELLSDSKLRELRRQEEEEEENKRETNNNNSREQCERRRRHSDSSLAHLKLPPGPMGLPFLGYLPFVGREIHLTLTSLSERYGPIYQIFLGGIRVVVLNDASLVRQAFKQPVFSGRPDTQLTRILQGYGIVNSDGALWKEQRAFLHTALRKLGAKSLMNGSNGLESKIQHQVKEFVNDLSANADEGKPCQVRPIVARAVSSVVGSIVMNLTYRKYEEKEKFDRLIELMQEGFRLFTIAMPLDFIPIFRFLPGVSYAYKKMKRNWAETSAFFQGVADEHRKYLNETFNLGKTANSPLHPRNSADGASGQQQQQQLAGSNSQDSANWMEEQQHHQVQPQMVGARSLLQQPSCNSTGPSPNRKAPQVGGAKLQQRRQQQQQQNHVELENIVARDLVDAYIVQQKRHEKDGKENYFSDQQLVQIMSDIFSAGLETVTSTIEWSILFLILNTKCQDEIQREIDRVIGRHRMPQLEDLSQMAYTEATIYEVLRRSNVVALGNAHATLDDASIGGFRIPKGTQVLPNLYCIHMNPKLWHEPDRFEPQRFIVNDKAQKPEYFIPFSVGRRMCLGDVLAKMEVFLFLVGLLQKYDLSVPEEDRHCPPQIKGTIGVSNTPASFRVALRRRDAGHLGGPNKTMSFGGGGGAMDERSSREPQREPSTCST